MPDPATQRGQIFTVEDGVVVVEWYDFGEDVAYEFAVQLRLDQIGQAKIAAALGVTDALDPVALKDILQERFGSYFAVREFADLHDVAYQIEREMQP